MLCVQEEGRSPAHYSFGYQRATLLGGFFNGVFLLALGLSVLLQSIERFVELEEVRNPKTVLIVGGVGLALNILSMAFVHEHHGHGHEHSHSQSHSHSDSHSHEHKHAHSHTPGTTTDSPDLNFPETSTTKGISSAIEATLNVIPVQDEHADHHHSKAVQVLKKHRDFGMLGVFLHLVGDAINNIGVMISAVIIWQTTSPSRFYADPAISLFIAFSIILTALPLIRRSGRILLDSAPAELDIAGVEKDIVAIPGILDAHDLHVWSLTQKKRIASVHVATSEDSIQSFMAAAQKVRECLHHWSIHSVTIQPEYVDPLRAAHEATRSISSPSTPALSFTVLSTPPDTDHDGEIEEDTPPSNNVTEVMKLKQRRCQLRCPPSSSCENLICCS
ncbi:hypothetical protein BT69DRAFT_1271636 [Atractiella rhizophila]|nr:hypothetical protein BT69DRAFT_1271636 [Atractiella rhizophila]